jgi:ligand-binding sensor domain-containing protein
MNRLTHSTFLALTLASLIAAAVLLFPTIARSQNPEWLNFTSGANVYAIADDGDYLWIRGGGLTRLNKATGEMVFYNRTNFGLLSNHVQAFAIDGQGNKWIGTGWGGVAKFDGVSWTIYTSGNSGLPGNYVRALAIDAQGNKWIGTWFGGVAKFDSVNWTVYNTGNSGLPGNNVNALASDGQGNIWIGT